MSRDGLIEGFSISACDAAAKAIKARHGVTVSSVKRAEREEPGNFHVVIQREDTANPGDLAFRFAGSEIDREAGTVGTAILTFDGLDMDIHTFAAIADKITQRGIEATASPDHFRLIVRNPTSKQMAEVAAVWAETVPFPTPQHN